VFELHHLSAREQWQWLHRGEISPSELVAHYLARIEKLNDEVGAFITVTADAATDRARQLESLVPKTAALWGIPFADKDLTRRIGVRMTFGSRLFENWVADETDELAVVLDDAGGVSLGKTTVPEFGLSSYSESLVAPPARNPYDLALGAGGSSGGAAVAVAAGLLPLAPGSDGGGSIRIPAAATGLVGLKPSRGRVPASSGFDSLGGLVVAGPIARTVGDAAMFLDAMISSGSYEFATGAPQWNGGPLSNAAERATGRFEIAVMTSSPWDSEYEITLDLEANAAVAAATEALRVLGHGLQELVLAPDDFFAAAFRALWQAGAASIPARGDELELLEPLTRWLAVKGRELSGEQLAGALATLANYERSVIRQFAQVDAVLTPSLAQTPRPIGWYDAVDPERNFAQQCQYTPFTAIANVAGLPAITLPVFETAAGVPMGVQLIGRPGGEHTLLSIGAQLERHFSWQKRHPARW
jgi:amidase